MGRQTYPHSEIFVVEWVEGRVKCLLKSRLGIDI